MIAILNLMTCESLAFKSFGPLDFRSHPSLNLQLILQNKLLLLITWRIMAM